MVERSCWSLSGRGAVFGRGTPARRARCAVSWRGEEDRKSQRGNDAQSTSVRRTQTEETIPEGITGESVGRYNSLSSLARCKT
eukprot:1349670-Rhodomonas_salina.1